MKSSIVAVALVAVAGCATAGGGSGRQAARYTGYPYDITDDGSRISGLVCGVNVDYSITQQPGLTRVSGFGAGSVFMEVRDAGGGARRVTGSLRAGPDRGELDVLVAPNALRGRAGIRDVDLAGVGDALEGQYKMRNVIGSAEMRIDGRAELVRMPDAELAALVPLMLNCEGPVGRSLVQGPPVAIRFGGPPGYETRAANEIR